MASSTSDWKWLSKHLLYLILDKLVSPIDYLRFSAICVEWHSIAKENESKRIKMLCYHQVPMLLVPSDEEQDTWSIYDVLDNEFLHTKLSIPHGKRFGGSSEGWLVAVEENNAVTLYKPFSMVKANNSGNTDTTAIHLPCLFPPDHRYENYDYHVSKAIITADPLENPKECIIVIIFSDLCTLSFIRLGKDTTWINVDVYDVLQLNCFHEVVYYNDRFYAVDISGNLVSFDVRDPINMDIKLIAHYSPPIEYEDGYDPYESDDEEDDDEEDKDSDDDNEYNNTINDSDNDEDVDDDDDDDEDADGRCCYPNGDTKKYLVKTCQGELWQIVRCFHRGSNRSTRVIKAYKLDYIRSRWVEIETLGDIALFLGDNSSISVVASSFPGCQPNCIYFTHDYDTFPYHSHGPCDLGIYHVESGEIEWHYTIDLVSIAKMLERPPIWVVPTIRF